MQMKIEDNDIPSYEELVLELARQVKFNKPVKDSFKDLKLFEDNSILEDISEEVDFPQEVDEQKICFEDMSEEDTVKKLRRKKNGI